MYLIRINVNNKRLAQYQFLFSPAWAGRFAFAHDVATRIVAASKFIGATPPGFKPPSRCHWNGELPFEAVEIMATLC